MHDRLLSFGFTGHSNQWKFWYTILIDRVKNFHHCSVNIEKKGSLKHPINLHHQNAITERKILC